jgi:hypothetical protein
MPILRGELDNERCYGVRGFHADLASFLVSVTGNENCLNVLVMIFMMMMASGPGTNSYRSDINGMMPQTEYCQWFDSNDSPVGGTAVLLPVILLARFEHFTYVLSPALTRSHD